MTHVSRNKLTPRVEKQLTSIFQTVLTRISNLEEMEVFLGSFLTETEKLMLAKRLAIAVLVVQGLPDSQVAQTLQVTRITVAKMRYFIEARGQGYKIAFKKIGQEKELQNIKRILLDVASYSVRAMGGRA